MTQENVVASAVKSPLVEVALSVQFSSSKDIHQAYLGAFWWTLREQFPVVSSVQEVPGDKEEFSLQPWTSAIGVKFEFSNEAFARLQMTADDDQWMWQIQRNRLIINWRKRRDEYPTYSGTSRKFFEAWKTWTDFFEGHGIHLSPIMWELVYVNRVTESTLLTAPEDWGAMFPGLFANYSNAINDLKFQGVQGKWVWESKFPPCRIYVEPRPAKSSGLRELLLSLTARGPLNRDVKGSHVNSDMESITESFNWGHESVTKVFSHITCDRLKNEWIRHE